LQENIMSDDKLEMPSIEDNEKDEQQQEPQPIHVDKSVKPLRPEHHNPISNFLHKNSSVRKAKDDDELIDIHIGNPLRRITELLEEIKKQKAFTFDIRGSLGAAGLVLVIGTFGLFGGSKALCSKGVQTKVGGVKILTYQQVPDETLWDKIPLLNTLLNRQPQPRVILVEHSGNAIRLKGLPQNITASESQSEYLATGEFDSCSQTLDILSPTDVEVFE